MTFGSFLPRERSRDKPGQIGLPTKSVPAYCHEFRERLGLDQNECRSPDERSDIRDGA